ncbi:MAG: hypothetical protein U9Q66_00185 [Patescibacteria group bacterium]|nr:hypothetical protein [Patescibacteria group bacterium]
MNIVDIDSLTSDYKKLLLTSMVIDNSLDVTFKYNADYLNTKILRDFVDEAFTLFDVDKKWISRLILISDELNNNAIEY